MNKRISAAFVIMLFMLGTFAAPVSAHTSLGSFKGTYDFHDNDSDPHVDGVVGYVWPGAGPISAGIPGWTPYPGYQSPYPGGWPPGMRPDWYQLDSTYYAPFGAILTSTLKANTPFNKMKVSGNPTIETAGTWVDGASMAIEHANRGDLVFGFHAWGFGEQELPFFNHDFDLLEIEIPPEFTDIDRKGVVCSWTNNYDLISVGTQVMENYVAPGWTYVSIYADPHFPIRFTPIQVDESLIWHSEEWYYVRINDVVAPTIGGRYFFKVFLRSKTADPAVRTFEIPAVYPLKPLACPVENWPVLLVKGEVDPGIITGTIRYGGWNPIFYGLAAALPGRVRAVGIADDPYTFKSTGRPVEFRTYFNHDANGHYEVEGVAAGTYDVYASLAGYPEIKIASGVKVLKGQSVHVDGYLNPGAVIHGEVFSKCGTGEVDWRCGPRENPRAAWASNQRIKIELYRSLADAEGTKPASSSTLAVSWSPSYYYTTYNRVSLYRPITQAIQFAWPHLIPGNYPDGDLGRDADGVGPSQQWIVQIGRFNFVWQFGDKGFFGAPTFWTGHIPQALATWGDGLGAGTYWVRGWTHGYVQTKADGVTFEPVSFTVASLEWPGDYYVPFDLRLGSHIVKEFHLHNVPGSLEDNGWNLPDRYSRTVYFYVDVKDAAGTTWGWAVRSFTIAELGALDYKAVTVRGLLGRNPYWRSYGFPAGIYTVKGYMAGYLDQHPTKVSLGLCGSEVAFSDHLDRGAMFDFGIYSVDWEHPSVLKEWSWHHEGMYVQIYDAAGKALGSTSYDEGGITVLNSWPFFVMTVPVYWGIPVACQIAGTDHILISGYYGAEGYYTSTGYPGYYPLAFESGTYSFKVFTYGYVQKKPFTVYCAKGAKADIPIKLVQGAEVTFDIIFKREHVMDHLRYDSAVRVRLFDDKGTLVGEALTSDYTKAYANAPRTWRENNAQLDPESLYYVDALGYINYIPSCTTRLKGLIAGLPDLKRGSRWYIDGFKGFSPDPYFDMSWTGSPIPAPYGIDAYPNYKGGWTIEVDVVPWYHNRFDPYRVVTRSTIYAEGTTTYTDLTTYATMSTGTTATPTATIQTIYPVTTYVETDVVTLIMVTGTITYLTATTTMTTVIETTTHSTTMTSFGTATTIYATTSTDLSTETITATEAYTTEVIGPAHITVYYPPPPGVLTGESPKYIPENHWGPYEQRAKIIVPGAHLGGEASVVFELDLRGLVQGTVYGYTHCGDWRSASWVTILALAADGKEYKWYSFDGAYEMWLTPGTYTLHVIPWTPTMQEGFKVQTLPGYAVSEGSQLSMDFFLEQSGVPIPEFPVTAIVLASALAASLFILRRRRKQ